MFVGEGISQVRPQPQLASLRAAGSAVAWAWTHEEPNNFWKAKWNLIKRPHPSHSNHSNVMVVFCVSNPARFQSKALLNAAVLLLQRALLDFASFGRQNPELLTLHGSNSDKRQRKKLSYSVSFCASSENPYVSILLDTPIRYPMKSYRPILHQRWPSPRSQRWRQILETSDFASPSQ